MTREQDEVLDRPADPVPAPPRGLSSLAARGAAVTLGGQLARILLQAVTLVVLSRLLGAHDYGLLAEALVVVGIGEIFRDFGLSSAAVQAPTLSRAQRDTLFWINSVLGLALAGTVLLLAPLVGDLFHEPGLVPVVRWVSLTFVVNGLATQYRADLMRGMRFGALAVADLAAQAVAFVVAVACGVAGAGVWALVAQQVVQYTVALVAVACLAGWLPGRPGRGVGVRPMLRFGVNLALTQVLTYAGSNIDVLTIGTRFGARPLGVYNRAYQLLWNPLNQLRTPATTVALPVLSRLADDTDRAGVYLTRAQLTIGYSVVPALAIGAGAGVPLVSLVLGPHWYGAAPLFQLLCLAGIFSMLSFVGYWVYLSRGLTAQLMRYSLISVAIRVVTVLGGSAWGVEGVAAGFAAAPMLAWPLSLWWLSRCTAIPVADLVSGALRILLVAAPAGLASWSVAGLYGDGPGLAACAASVAAGLAVYVLAAVCSRPVGRDVRDVVDFVRRARS